MAASINIGVVQMACVQEPTQNLATTIDHIKSLANQGAQVICLQELFSSLYFCDREAYENFELAESVPGPTTDRFCALAAELEVVLVASLFEKRTSGIYHNTLAVIDADGSYLGKYRKMHIPDDPGYFEKFYFTPGDLGYKVFDTRYLKIGTLICWDQWFPEAARLTALQGAQLLVYPTAIGWDQSQDQPTNDEQFEAWQTIQRSHAIANGVHVVAVNRVGVEGNMKFWGGSMVVNPMGKILWSADQEPVNQVVAISPQETDFYRTHWPFLRDRRIETYSGLNQRYIDD